MPDAWRVPRSTVIPRDYRLLPFRGSDAVRAGILTWSRLRHGGWIRLLPDVYVAAGVEIDHRTWCRAALVLARSEPRAAVSGLSAAYLWGVDLLPLAGQPAELTVPRSSSLRSRPGSLVVIRSDLQACDIRTFADARLTTPERTAFDLVRRRDRVEGIVALDAMLRRGVVSPAQLAAHAAGMRPGAPGIRLFADALEMAEPRAESPMETRLRVLFTDHGLPRPTAQYVIRTASGLFVARVDLAYPEYEIAIEYDGDHHRERAQFQRDVRRRNAIEAAGWRVVSVTANDILREPAHVLDHVRRLMDEARSARP